MEMGSRYPPPGPSTSGQVVQWVALLFLLAAVGIFAYLLYTGAIVL